MDAIAVSSPSPRRRRRSRTGSVVRGRIYLVVIFLLLRAQEIWIYFATPEYDRQSYLSVALPCAILSTAFLAGIWCRENWVRFLFVLLMFARLTLALVALPRSIDAMRADPQFAIRFLSGPILFVGAALAVIHLLDIERLVTRKYS